MNDLIKYDVFYLKWTYLVWYFVLSYINHVKSYLLYHIICSLIYCHIITHHIINHHKLSHIKYCPIISNIFTSYSVEMVWNVKYFLQLRLVKLCLSSFTQTGFSHQTIIKTSLFHTVLEINPSRLASFCLAGNWDRLFHQFVHRRAQQARLSACCFMKTGTSPEEERSADLTLPLLLSWHLSQTFC